MSETQALSVVLVGSGFNRLPVSTVGAALAVSVNQAESMIAVLMEGRKGFGR